MSQPSTSVSVHQTPATTTSSDIERIFDAALKSYKKKTKKDLKSHDLFKQLETCDSPAAILAVFQTAQFDTGSDDRLKTWLVPALNVLCAFSNTLGEGVSLAFPPAKAVFAGVGVLLSVFKDIAESRDILVDIFGRIGSFFMRLEVYTGVPLTPAMTDKMVQITVEILGIIATATKEMKRSAAKKFLKRVIGRTDLEDGMKKLDKLTNEEVVMASAQLLKVTHNIDNKVTEVDENLLVVKDEVQLVNDNVKAIGDNVQTMAVDGEAVAKEVKSIVQQAADGVNNVKRNQLRESLRKWQSPPDPSTNHHIVGGRQYKGTTEWFTDSDKCHKWKAAGSLLWIHGKRSGKSVLCSAIINNVTTLHKARSASMAYFYFDFRDVDKKSCHSLLRSLLVQLSTCSDAFCDVLFRLYETHDDGSRQPGDKELTQCLKEMLSLPDQCPVYLILDALDECPDTFDLPSAREQVLDLLKDLIVLRLPSLRICVTSRPEVDISDALGSLASQSVSLQDEPGQKNDISDYVRSVVYSGSGTFMRRWRIEDKEHVIETLSERADGMFRWVFCQLEMLRNCLPQNVRRVLQELPASLDETYERMLREILKANPDQTFRLLQCLTVATRPLRVDELAEVLTLDFDTAEEGIPALNKDWRWDDERQGVLATCSSLIVVVDSYDYNSWRKIRLVQFAHFSVKEFLTSDRLAGIKADISRFHIRLEPAHTVITQACLGVLLQSDYDDRVKSSSSLSKYAARYWVGHAQFENVSSHIEGGMRRLFDPAKRHFIAWLDSYNLDNKWVSFLEGDLHSSTSWHPNSASFGQEDTAPCLYYAALCGFYDLTKYLIFKNPLHVNARVGLNKSSLVAALHNRHFRVVELLYQHGAVLPIGYEGRTLLHAASADGRVDVAQWLLNIGVDANAQDDGHRTPLHFAAANGHPELVQILLGHSVDVNARDWSHRTPLHLASKSFRGEESVRLLIEHGASVNARDGNHQMPLHLASSKGHFGTVQLLIENGAHVNARDWRHQTPLYLALFECAGKTARLLIKHGAGIHALSLNRSTALHLASSQGDTETVWLLIKHGADVDAQDHDQSTPLHKASSLPFWINAETIVRLLIEHGASVDAYDKNHQTPLHRVSSCDYPNSDSLRLLLENGADADVEDDKGSTPFQMASSKENWSREHRDIVQLLLDHSARVVSNSM